MESKGLARLVARDATSMTIEVLGQTETYNIEKVFEFSSERKMMSVVARNKASEELMLLAKGASDSLQSKLS